MRGLNLKSVYLNNEINSALFKLYLEQNLKGTYLNKSIIQSRIINANAQFLNIQFRNQLSIKRFINNESILNYHTYPYGWTLSQKHTKM